MKRKGLICISLIFCLLFLYGCSTESSSMDEYAQEDAYQTGYDKGYKDGIEYVLSSLRENADNWQTYMDIEDIEDSIRSYYRNDSTVDVDLIRDDIIYHPDFEHYTLAELLEKLIDASVDEQSTIDAK